MLSLKCQVFGADVVAAGFTGVPKVCDFVDLPRIELGTAQCECAGIPLTYKPVPKYVINKQKTNQYLHM